MTTPAQNLIRGTCACGRKFRIRNAVPGTAVTCPACGRPILISDADLRLAAAGERIVPRQPDDDMPLEAAPLDHGGVRIAREGSRPGISSRTTLHHDDALLASALARGWGIAGTDTTPTGPDSPQAVAERRGRRGFVGDMIASFYFAASTSNALNVLATAGACSLCTLLLYLPLPLGPIRLLGLIPLFLLGAYVIQFYWSVLRETANGEDEISWFGADWDLWDDAGKPLFWIGCITVMCTLPAMLVTGLVPDPHPWKTHATWAALLAGLMLWPVGVMSVAIGNTITFARPDWLLRCIIGIGPVYLLAWTLVMMVIVGWWWFFRLAGDMVLVPIVGVFINLYLGYVLFRMLGLIYYHFRDRFPWRFED